MAYIDLKDVSFAYPNGYVAVDNISLSIEKGENIAIVGQNGAGKSTTVKLLNALHYPSKGTVTIGDMLTDDHTTAEVSRVVGYVFQNPDDQIFHSTARAEVEYALVKMGIGMEEVNKRVDEALELTGIFRFAETNPYNLPLSTRKFVTIAALVAMDCEVMIFDEPTAGQDLVGNQKLAEIFVKLSERGKTLITISHDMEFVVNNFKKIVVMANKKIIKTGTPQEIFWDFDVLKEAMLKQPYVSNLCRELGIEGNVVYMEEACDMIYAKIKGE